jgi:hypothetical protein
MGGDDILRNVYIDLVQNGSDLLWKWSPVNPAQEGCSLPIPEVPRALYNCKVPHLKMLWSREWEHESRSKATNKNVATFLANPFTSQPRGDRINLELKSSRSGWIWRLHGIHKSCLWTSKSMEIRRHAEHCKLWITEDLASEEWFLINSTELEFSLESKKRE